MIGIDLSQFYLSVEWDILEIPASRNEEYYPCCPEPFSGKILIIIIGHKKVKPQESGLPIYFWYKNPINLVTLNFLVTR
jgi:hypothetical protein